MGTRSEHRWLEDYHKRREPQPSHVKCKGFFVGIDDRRLGTLIAWENSLLVLRVRRMPSIFPITKAQSRSHEMHTQFAQ